MSEESVSTFLFLQKMFQLPCLTQRHCFARPSELPRSTIVRPGAHAPVVIIHPADHVVSQANIESSFFILDDVDLIHNAFTKKPSRADGRANNWVQGLDLNQRPSGYEPDELPGCSTLQQKRAQRARHDFFCQPRFRESPNSRLPEFPALSVLNRSVS